jgi:hypothetical protein
MVVVRALSIISLSVFTAIDGVEKRRFTKDRGWVLGTGGWGCNSEGENRRMKCEG